MNNAISGTSSTSGISILSRISNLVYKNSPSGTYEQKVATVNIGDKIPSGEYIYYGRADDFNDIANKINEIIDKLKCLPEIPEKTSQLINDSGFISGDTFNLRYFCIIWIII